MEQEVTDVRNVFVSKTGVLHVQSPPAPWHAPGRVYTFGTWKGGRISGACRILDPSKLTPAGTLARTGYDKWAYTYHPDAEHI